MPLRIIESNKGYYWVLRLIIESPPVNQPVKEDTGLTKVPTVLKYLAKKIETASPAKRYHHVSSDSEEEEIKPSKRSALSVQFSHEELKKALLKYGMHLRQLAEGEVHCNYY